jgi:hypothetical protein
MSFFSHYRHSISLILRFNILVLVRKFLAPKCAESLCFLMTCEREKSEKIRNGVSTVMLLFPSIPFFNLIQLFLGSLKIHYHSDNGYTRVSEIHMFCSSARLNNYYYFSVGMLIDLNMISWYVPNLIYLYTFVNIPGLQDEFGYDLVVKYKCTWGVYTMELCCEF